MENLLDEKKRSAFAALCRRLNVTTAYLFGSCVEGSAGPLSDLDLALLLGSPHAPASYQDRRLEATTDLMHLFHVPRVDVVILNTAPPLLRYRVIEQGRLLLDLDPKTRVAFEAQAIRSYCDTQPLRKAYDAALIQAIQAGRFYG